MDLKEFKNKIQNFDTIEEVHEEARLLLEKNSDLNLDLFSTHDIEQLTEEEINILYTDFIKESKDELRGVLGDDATHNELSIEFAVEDLVEKMEKDRSSYLYMYKEDMKKKLISLDELSICHEKIEIIFPYLDSSEEKLYQEVDSIIEFNKKQQEQFGINKKQQDFSIEVDGDLYISGFEEQQQEKIKEALIFKLDKMEHIGDVNLYVEQQMEFGTLLDVEDLITQKQIEVLFKTDKVYEKEMTREQGMEM